MRKKKRCKSISDLQKMCATGKNKTVIASKQKNSWEYVFHPKFEAKFEAWNRLEIPRHLQRAPKIAGDCCAEQAVWRVPYARLDAVGRWIFNRRFSILEDAHFANLKNPNFLTRKNSTLHHELGSETLRFKMANCLFQFEFGSKLSRCLEAGDLVISPIGNRTPSD